MVIDGCSQFSLLDHQRRKCMNVRPWSFSRFDFFERWKKFSKSFPFGKKKEMFEGPKIHDEFPHCRDVSCVFRGCETENHLIVTRHSLTPILEDFDSEPEKKNHIFVCQRNRPNSRKANDGRGSKTRIPFSPLAPNPFPSPSIRIGNRTLRKVSSIQER